MNVMPSSLLPALQLGAHLDAQERIERGQRLVEEQHLGLGDERAGQRHALLLAARELRRLDAGASASIATSFRSSVALAWRSALPTPRIFRANATLSSAVRCGKSA